MTGRRLLTGVLLVLSGVQPLFASGSSSQQAAQQLAPARPAPYKKLFQLQPLEEVARAQRREKAARPAAPRVVCGMTLIPVDPAIDPKMLVEPKNGDTRYTIRAIEPPICK